MAHAAAEVLQLEGRVLLSTTTLTPTADAYTRDGTYANTNYGSATDLAVKYASISGQGYNRNAFCTFNLSGVSSVGEAVLRVYGAVSDSSTLTIGALPVSTTTWGQNTITWNNQPSAGTSISATVISGTTARWLQFDVTSYLQTQKAAGATSVSIELAGLTSTTGDGDFNSTNDGSNQPQLVVNSSDASLTPTNDAYVLDSSPNSNYGTSTTLVTKKANANNRNIFVTFDTSSYTGTDSGAFLQFYGNNSSGTETYIPVNVYSVATTTWAQGTITWNNQPTAGTTVQGSSIVIDGTSRLYTFDVSSYVAAQRTAGYNTVSFMIQSGATTTSSAPTFNSTNATANKPQLVLSGTPSAPTVATPASASADADPTGIDLSVLGAATAGESTLTYTWAKTSGPNVTFVDNGDNSASSTVAVIGAAGTYNFQATISNGSQSVTSTTAFTVAQTATSMAINQPGAALNNGGTKTFTATVVDQFGNAISSPTLQWSVTGIGGTIGSAGNYTAPSSGTGTDTITATSGSITQTTLVEVGAVAGTVVFDASGTGTPGSNPPGLSGWTVYEDQNNSGQIGGNDPSKTSDINGNFALPAITGTGTGYGGSSGSAVLRAVALSGWNFTVGSSGIPLGVGQVLAGTQFAGAVPAGATLAANPSYTVAEGQQVTVGGTFTGAAAGTPVTIKVLDQGVNASEVTGQKNLIGDDQTVQVDNTGHFSFLLNSLSPAQNLQVTFSSAGQTATTFLTVHKVDLSFNVNQVTLSSVATSPNHTASVTITAKDDVTSQDVGGISLQPFSSDGIVFNVQSVTRITGIDGTLPVTLTGRAFATKQYFLGVTVSKDTVEPAAKLPVGVTS